LHPCHFFSPSAPARQGARWPASPSFCTRRRSALFRDIILDVADIGRR
jgi:hypothetical protein